MGATIIIVLAVIARVLAYVLMYVLMYAAYRPYTDSLAVKAGLGVLSFGMLAGLVGTATSGAPLSAIPLNFLAASVSIVIAFVILHYIDRWLFAPRH